MQAAKNSAAVLFSDAGAVRHTWIETERRHAARQNKYSVLALVTCPAQRRLIVGAIGSAFGERDVMIAERGQVWIGVIAGRVVTSVMVTPQNALRVAHRGKGQLVANQAQWLEAMPLSILKLDHNGRHSISSWIALPVALD